MIMKYVIVCILLWVSVLCSASTETKFQEFISKYNKSYSAAEHDRRYLVFQKNLKRIDQLNKQRPKTQFGITKFADLSPEEFKSMYLSSVPMSVSDPSWPVAELSSKRDIQALPDTWDWRTQGAVTPVKNQGACGSCWAFSAVGNMEGQWFLAGHTLIGLSEQNLVDCDHHCYEYLNESTCDAGCEGGLMANAFMYVIGNGGIDTEDSYPYEGTDDSCNFTTKNIGAKMRNYTMIAQDEDQIAAYLVKNGPVSIAADAVMWQFYVGGVFEDPWCGDNLDHGILIVGYNHEIDIFGQEIEYWIIKNSWGPDFGYDGYIYLERGSDECGMNLYACSAIA